MSEIEILNMRNTPCVTDYKEGSPLALAWGS